MKNLKKPIKIVGQKIENLDKKITPKSLYKTNLIINCLNIGIFAALCLAVFTIIIVPIVQWLYYLEQTPLKEYFIKVWYVGIPLLAFTLVYGVTLFWPLLVKFNHLQYNGHNIDIYLGVKTIIICVNNKVVGYANHGFYSCPEITWYLEIGDEYTTIDVVQKNQYKIELNSEPINFHKIELESKKVVGTK